MLAAAVQAGHDDADAVGAAGNGLDQTHQVLEVVVRGEMVLISEQLIGNTVVARIDEDIQVVAAGGRLDETLCVAGLETRAVGRDDEGVDIRVADLARPADEVTVNEFAKLLCAGAGNQTEIGDCVLFGKEITRAKILFSHYRYSLLPSCIHLRRGGAACRNAPFTSIVAQRRDKISPARQEFLHFRHFPRFKHCKPRK